MTNTTYLCKRCGEKADLCNINDNDQRIYCTNECCANHNRGYSIEDRLFVTHYRVQKDDWSCREIIEEVSILREKLFKTINGFKANIAYDTWIILDDIDTELVNIIVDSSKSEQKEQRYKVKKHIKGLLEEGYSKREIATMTEHTSNWVNEILGSD